jgi:hypothetical protein
MDSFKGDFAERFIAVSGRMAGRNIGIVALCRRRASRH